MTQAPPEARTGEVFDLGYQRYLGRREGRGRARRAIWADSIRATLGLGRGAWSKLLPWAIIAMSIIPALIIVTVIGFLSSFGADPQDIPVDFLSNGGYYEYAITPLMLFAAILAPEMLCPDRRSGVLVLYFTRPLTTTDYVWSRWAGFATVTAVILWIPQLLVFLALVLSAGEPLDWLVDNLDLVPRFLLSGAVIAAFLTTIGLAASSLTTRRAYAAAFILGFFVVSSAVGVIVEELTTGAASDWALLIIAIRAPLSVNDWIFGIHEGALPAAVDLGWTAILILAAAIVLQLRYLEPPE